MAKNNKKEEKKSILSNLKDRIFSGDRKSEEQVKEEQNDESVIDVEVTKENVDKFNIKELSKPTNSFSAALAANNAKRAADVKRIRESAAGKMEERQELETKMQGHGQKQD